MKTKIQKNRRIINEEKENQLMMRMLNGDERGDENEERANRVSDHWSCVLFVVLIERVMILLCVVNVMIMLFIHKYNILKNQESLWWCPKRKLPLRWQQPSPGLITSSLFLSCNNHI